MSEGAPTTTIGVSRQELLGRILEELGHPDTTVRLPRNEADSNQYVGVVDFYLEEAGNPQRYLHTMPYDEATGLRPEQASLELSPAERSSMRQYQLIGRHFIQPHLAEHAIRAGLWVARILRQPEADDKLGEELEAWIESVKTQSPPVTGE
jgi:hypothetical protein